MSGYRHEIDLQQVGDTGLVHAVCSCGRYRSIACQPYRAVELGRKHRAYRAKVEKRLTDG